MDHPHNRRSFLRFLGGAAAGACAAAHLPSTACALARAPAGSKRPNFLFLFTDDQTFRSIGCLNNPEVKTPNIDKLVARGTTFTHAFNQGSWTGAVCVASRAMLNTGLNLVHAQKRIESTPLWGETLGQAGYSTFFTGKWHNGNRTLQKSFKTIGDTGGGMFVSTPTSGSAYRRPAPGNKWSPSDTSLKGHWRPAKGGGVVHSSKLWADNAISFLKNKAAGSDKPFFMYVAFHAPHDPRQSPKQYVDMYPPDKVEVPPNYLPEHPFDQGDHKLRDEVLAPFPRTKHAVQVHRQEYYAIITHADAQIGRILKALDESGKADDTIIIFSADHGLAVGQHGLMGKQNQYNHSVRLPMVFAGPGIEKGRKIDAMVYLHSLFPTTCELAGVPVPRQVESGSLVGLLKGRQADIHDAIYGGYKSLQRMVRTKDYKLIIYPAAGKTQLFDIRNDPWELKNLAGNAKYAPRIAELKQRLKQLQKEVGDGLDLDKPPAGKSGRKGRKQRGR